MTCPRTCRPWRILHNLRCAARHLRLAALTALCLR